MNKIKLILLVTLIVTSNCYAQSECKEPHLKATFKHKFEDIGVSHSDFLRDATVITYKSLSSQLQWVGLYWEGPIMGAILAYDCQGKLLSIQQTGGIKSIEYFNAPGKLGSAIAVEEIATGTGYYAIQYTIYSLKKGKIIKLWSHMKYESNGVIPWNDRIVDLFEIEQAGSKEHSGDKIIAEGVRKIYPATEKVASAFRVEKLPSESYCWNNTKEAYESCE